MTEEELLRKIASINTWSNGERRAPHKPLLILYALGQLQAGKTQLLYSDHYQHLARMLKTFGSPRLQRPQYPFVRLANDGIWQVEGNVVLDTKEDYSTKSLVGKNVIGMFSQEVLETFQNSPERVIKAAEFLLEKNFPPSYYSDILMLSGLKIDRWQLTKRRTRDQEFRGKILEAYGASCAICQYEIRKDNQLIGLEAAHIKWHNAKGPDIESNGLALCVMHHELFDFGLFSINEDLIVRVADNVAGFRAKDWLYQFHNKPIAKPRSPNHYPDQEFTNWHVNEVFKGGYWERK